MPSQLPSPDDIITAVTRAPGKAGALAVVAQVRHAATLLAVADMLYIEPEGHGLLWVRKEIVRVARQ